MKPSSVFVLAAAIMFFVAAGFAAYEEGRTPAQLIFAYASLGAANTFFAYL